MNKKWGTTCGVWGDVLVGLGYFLDRIGEGKILYLGNNDQIVNFLKCQPFITNVQKIPVEELEWQKYWMHTVFWKTNFVDNPNYTTTPEAPFLKAGYLESHFKITHLTHEDAISSAPIVQWHGVKLPKEISDWAEEMASKLPNEFYLFQPFSYNSNNPLDHWSNWNQLCKLITKRTNKKLVVIGNNWVPRTEHYYSHILSSETISLYNETPSMMHVFALARYASGVITTSNSLAHWCQVDDLPCTVICNKKSTRPGYIFRRVLKWPTLNFVEYDEETELAFNKISEHLFSKRNFI